MAYTFDDDIIGLDPDDKGHLPLDIDDAFDCISKLPDAFEITVQTVVKLKPAPDDIKTPNNGRGFSF
jgi:hypothetical protein